MVDSSRRRFLAGLGFGATALAGGASARSEPQPTSDRSPSDRPGLDRIARVVRETARDAVFEKALALRGEGATERDLLGGVFLAGVHDIVPRPVGFKFHAVLMTSSAYQVLEAAPASDRLLPVLFNLDDFKRAQADDRRQGDWRLPDPPRVEIVDAATASAGFQKAMDLWDEDGADRAVAQLCAAASLDDAFEVLWPYGARDFGDIGHKMIYATQAYRTLQQIGWRCARPVLRSLVYGLLDGKPGENDHTFAPNRKLAERIPEGWTIGAPDPKASAALLAGLREDDPQQAARRVVAALKDGTAPESLWDGLGLFAFELVTRSPGILSVHAVTTLNAFRSAFETSRIDATRRLLLLQAASWSILYRDFLGRRRGFDADRPGIDLLTGTARKPSPESVFELASRDRDAAASAAMTLVADDGTAGFARSARRLLMRKVKEHHDYKYAAAALEEIDRADPHWRPALAGASMFYLRTGAEEDGRFYRRAGPLLGF